MTAASLFRAHSLVSFLFEISRSKVKSMFSRPICRPKSAKLLPNRCKATSSSMFYHTIPFWDGVTVAKPTIASTPTTTAPSTSPTVVTSRSIKCARRLVASVGRKLIHVSFLDYSTNNKWWWNQTVVQL